MNIAASAQSHCCWTLTCQSAYQQVKHEKRCFSSRFGLLKIASCTAVIHLSCKRKPSPVTPLTPVPARQKLSLLNHANAPSVRSTRMFLLFLCFSAQSCVVKEAETWLRGTGHIKGEWRKRKKPRSLTPSHVSSP